MSSDNIYGSYKLIAVSFVLMLAGCSAIEVIIPPSDELIDEISTSRELWLKSGITDYRYTFRAAGGLCTSTPVSITVRSSQVRSVRYAGTARDCATGRKYKKGSDALAQSDARSHTMDDLFERLESCNDACVIMSALFHPGYGFPVAFRLGSAAEDGTMIEDAGYYGQTLAFEIL